MKRILSLIRHALQATRFRRRLTGTVLAGGLLVAGFYAEENWRGSRYLDAAREEARREGVPMSLLEACQEGERKDRNLYWSPVVQRRLVRKEPEMGRESGAALSVMGWGVLRDGRWGHRRDIWPNQSKGQRADLAGFRGIMEENGWLVPENLAPAEAVLEALRRYEVDLAEWALAIRERPDWQIPAADMTWAGDLRLLLHETSYLFALRAVAAAHAGHAGAEIVRDLESAAILAAQWVAAGGPVVDAVWEILGTGSLTDSEWAAVQALLVTEPRRLAYVRDVEADSLCGMERFVQPLGNGLPLGPAADLERREWIAYFDSVAKRFLRFAQPRGWHRLNEARAWAAMAANRRQARSMDSGWEKMEWPEAASPTSVPVWHHAVVRDESADIAAVRDLECCGSAGLIPGAIRSRLAIAAIAVERWHRQHNAWPDSLEAVAALVPGGAAALTGIGCQTTESGVTLSAERGSEWRVDDWVLPVPEWTPPPEKPAKSKR